MSSNMVQVFESSGEKNMFPLMFVYRTYFRFCEVEIFGKGLIKSQKS